MSARGRLWLRLAVGVILLGFILSRVGIPSTVRGLGLRTVGFIADAAVLLLAGQACAALRWKLVLGPGSPPWSYLARLYVIGGFFSLFLPTVVGGDAVRAVAAARATSRPGGVVASVLLDRALGMLALGGYALLGIALQPDFAARLSSAARLRSPLWLIVLAVAGAIVGMIGGVILARRSPTLRTQLDAAFGAARDLVRSPPTLLAAVGLGFVVQGLYILAWLLLAKAVSLPIAPRDLLLGVPVVTLAAMLPISLNGLGVREGAWLLLFSGSGIPPADIVTFSLSFFVTNLITGLVGGIVFMLRGTAQD